MTIYFYKVNEDNGCFSNFSTHGFKLQDNYWRTSEHYFQAMKFEGTDLFEKIRLATSAMDAANIGRDRSNPLRKDWEVVKDDIMRNAVLNKFLQNKDIAEVLKATKNEEIVEKTSYDYYWGCGKDGSGKNMLGKILMEVREKLCQLS